MPDAVYGHTLIFTQQLADFTGRSVGIQRGASYGLPIGIACGSRSDSRSAGQYYRGSAAGRRTQRRIILPDDQQQFVGGVTRVIDNLQQRFIGLRQRQPADLITRMADNNAVALR